MSNKTNKNHWIIVSPIRITVLLLFFSFLFLVTANAQTTGNKNLPAWQAYRGIKIDMPAAEVREKLGKPKSEDAESFFYEFSDTETAQILLDSDKKVRTISIIFSEDHKGAPAFSDVFGKSVEAQPKPDGSNFKMVRYEDAGFWISYSRSAGEKAMVAITIQKI